MLNPCLNLVRLYICLALALLVGGCVPAAEPRIPASSPTPAVDGAPGSPAVQTKSPSPVATGTPQPPQAVYMGFAAFTPSGLRAEFTLPAGLLPVTAANASDVVLQLARGAPQTNSAVWVYALVTAFPALLDNFSRGDLEQVWRGRAAGDLAEWQVWTSPETRAVFDAVLGLSKGVRVASEDDLLDRVWQADQALAIVPFERLEPRWKVLSVDGQNPLQRGLNLSQYPLVANFTLVAQTSAGETWLNRHPSSLVLTNRDESRLTTLVMTGVTALTRGTAEKMDLQGVDYPAKDIGETLRAADVTHLSNEVSFYPDCPAPEKRDPRFCSRPEYLQLLESIGADVIELTGNHLLDWGAQPFAETLSLYDEHDLQYYGGGMDAPSARAALKIIDHGNRLAFLGCNTAGPETVWASDERPGAAHCDFPWLNTEISRLQAEGWQVIVTFQHIEVCQLEPHLTQRADFAKPAAAGAVIVSGSQAHCPQALAFEGQTFIHYGLGNLFFDQMDAVARRQMIDRHVFYNGRYISTELLTAELEDQSRPRWMTAQERQKLLADVFRASGWIK